MMATGIDVYRAATGDNLWTTVGLNIGVDIFAAGALTAAINPIKDEAAWRVTYEVYSGLLSGTARAFAATDK